MQVEGVAVEDDLRAGDQSRSRHPSPRLHSPSSTDLETIDFIPTFDPEGGGKQGPITGGGSRGGGDVELRL